MKPSLKDPVFNRGCCKMRGEYVENQQVLNRSACKLNEFNNNIDYIVLLPFCQQQLLLFIFD